MEKCKSQTYNILNFLKGVIMADNIRTQACIDKLTLQPPDLTGSNVIVAVLDSGIDYFLPDFLD
jgi:subtilisin family serine protease